MKTVNQKGLFFLLLLTIVLIIGALSFYGYQAFGRFQTEKLTGMKVDALNDGNALLYAIGEERLYSSMLLGENNKKDLAELKKARNLVDSKIVSLLKDFDVFALSAQYKGILNKVRNDLKYTRSLVDSMNNDYYKILIDGYQKSILDKVLILLKRVKKSFGSVCCWSKQSQENLFSRCLQPLQKDI